MLLFFSAAPAPVSDLQLHSASDPFSLEASWGAAPGEQDGLRLYLYHLETQTWAHNISLPPDTLAYTFSDLLPGSEYILEVISQAGDLHAQTSAQQWTGKAGIGVGGGGIWE